MAMGDFIYNHLINLFTPLTILNFNNFNLILMKQAMLDSVVLGGGVRDSNLGWRCSNQPFWPLGPTTGY